MIKIKQIKQLIESQKEEFDNNQRRFLGGLLHSTQFNKWFDNSLHALLDAVIEMVSSEKLGGEGKPIFVGANASERMKIHNKAKDETIKTLQDIKKLI